MTKSILTSWSEKQPEGQITGEKKPAYKAGFSNVVGERGLRASLMLALRAVAKATWSRCARLKPPSEVLILYITGEKKPAYKAGFSNVVGERGLRASLMLALRAVAKARGLAALGSNLLRRFSSYK